MVRGRRKNTAQQTPVRSSTRRKATVQDALPEVYQDMLAEAIPSSPTRESEYGRTIKKRRVGGRVVTQSHHPTSDPPDGTTIENAGDADVELKDATTTLPPQQTAYADSEDSTESVMAWEEVDLKDGFKAEDATDESSNEDGDLNLVLNDQESTVQRSAKAKRKPTTAVERKLRFEIHKMHILCLFVHIHLRNHWCNDEKVQAVLKKLLPARTTSYLNPDESKSQFQRSRSFMDGLSQACAIFKDNFRITARGICRPRWAESVKDLAELNLPDDIELPMQKSDFRDTAGKLKASRDVGAQLFCALLRLAGVETRLVCSLQPLPFTATAKATTPQKAKPMFVVADPENMSTTSGDESVVDVGSDTSIRTVLSTGTGATPGQIRSRLATRLGRPLPMGYEPSSVPPPPKKPRQKRIRESSYPVYWVEAFNAAYQKWVPVDPIVTNTIAKPSKFEPPASDAENNMIYVIAFEEDGSARDVTRRYTKAYNAKTRRARVESIKGGERWWGRVMRMYKRLFDLDCDQVEDAELAAKEAAEEMPRNVQDFKDHPYYALERHLKRNEVIHPRREVGKVASGKLASSNGGKALEPIYRRRDVHVVKSADSWYRLGREIKPGEQPLKRVQPRRRQEVISDEDASNDEENAGTAMYSTFQTVSYQAPPVVNGRIPKNAYGNLDMYVPSMVPPGGAHIPHSETARAAKILNIDYSDAVTAFEFKGRHGTAVIKGAVIAIDYKEAVEEIIRGFEDERAHAEETKRSLEALRMWKRFLAGLRIRERIDGYEVEGERDMEEQLNDKDEDMLDNDVGGGFVPNEGEITVETTVGRRFGTFSPEDDDDKAGGFIQDDLDEIEPHNYQDAGEPVLYQQHSNHAEEDEQFGGGFVRIDERANEDEHEYEYEEEDEDAKEALFTVELNPFPVAVSNPPISTAIDQNNRSTKTNTSKEIDNVEGFLAKQPDDSPDLNKIPSPLLTATALKEAEQLQMLHQAEHTPRPNHVFVEPEPDAITPGQLCSPSPRPSADPDARITQPLPKNSNTASNDAIDVLEKRSASGGAEGIEAGDQESDEDRGSLLSHDPDDEDADPEWLV